MATYSPDDAVKTSDGGTLVEFDVSPNASETRVPSGFNEWRGRFEARLSEPATDGRANSELVDELAELLGADVKLVKGAGSTTKTVAVAEGRDDVLDALTRSIRR